MAPVLDNGHFGPFFRGVTYHETAPGVFAPLFFLSVTLELNSSKLCHTSKNHLNPHAGFWGLF